MPEERAIAVAGPRRTASPVAALAALLLFAGPAGAQDGPAAPDAGCLSCHAGIEESHPWFPLSCTECHGGDGEATTAGAAHVLPRVGWPSDERVMHSGFDPPAVRFRNPSDLRVADETCGACHGGVVERLRKSLHGTTAGHLNDGLYENGVNPTREAVYAIFAVEDDDGHVGEHALPRLESLERLRVRPRGSDLGSHFADLPRKSCNQCHLYSRGLAVRGRLGLDGLYRGDGCAACHVPYAEDGRSASADPSIDRFEPGHPLTHAMTAAPPTSTCVRCHVGDASIGNGFRGLAQLYPAMPAGPDVPGTTDRLVAEQFFLQDPVLLPPDVHHDAGMHCIDCHTSRDVMGDGDIHGAMEHAVGIECTSCHGTFEERADGLTERGRPVPNLRVRDGLVVMESKVTGRLHRVKQVVDVLDPDHPDHSPEATRAMTADHARLECYACHAGWNTNFFGFHFDRNEQFTQLDTMTGQTTPGLVSTQERVFATLRQLVLGWNPEGRIAPYMVGFSTMGTVHGPGGETVVDQALPETAAGLSGMTMIHHQTHTTQRAARSCVECHRSPATYGLGTGGDTGGSFALARGLVVVAGERGLETLLLDRETPERTVPLARVPLHGARAVVLDSDRVDGHARTAFVVQEGAGVAVVDVANPAFPRVVAFVAAGDARDVALAGGHLLVANGLAGLRVVDVSERERPRLVADLATHEARGLDVVWPRVLVADGAGGLLVADLSIPAEPRVVGRVRLALRGTDRPDDARAVDTVFQYGRPRGHDDRTPAGLYAVVANGTSGLAVVDVTEPGRAEVVSGIGGRYAGEASSRDVVVTGRYELGDTTGVTPTVERDLAYVLQTRGGGSTVLVVDVTAPRSLEIVDTLRVPGQAGGLALARSFVPPTLVSRLMVAHDLGLRGLDVTDSDAGATALDMPELQPLADVAVEAFAFDRMLDESGRPLKDISHPGSRFLTIGEIHRVLSVPGELLGAEAVPPASGRGAALAVRAGPGGSDGDGGRRTGDALMGGPGPDGPPRPGAGSEPLAGLLRASRPDEHDGNRDGALTRGELERLLFSVLDANGDGELCALEWPRHPAADPRRLDRDGDDVVSRREMAVGDDVMDALDLDGDGRVRSNEWPWAIVAEPFPCLSQTTVEALEETIGAARFRDEHPALYVAIAGRRRGEPLKPWDVPRERLEGHVAYAGANPLRDVAREPATGGFLERWDLDRDGEVEAWEYVPFERVAARCDTDGDGDIDLDDAGDRRR